MTHDEAIDRGACERYLLHELKDAERDAFEEHYFSCGVCAADVKAGADLTDALRAERPPRKRRKFSWTPPLAIAAAVMVGFVAYQQFVVLAPRVQSAVTLRSDVRGEGGPKNIVPAGGPIAVDFDIPADTPSPQYACSIVDAKGSRRAAVTVTAARAREPVRLLIPRGLAAGEYTLHVQATNRTEVLTIPFTVR